MNRNYMPGLGMVAVVLLSGCAPMQVVTSSGQTAEDLFSRFRSLEGSWTSTPDSAEMPPSTVTYHTIANGSAVVETVFAGTPHEMISVIFMDEDRLLMTHYCAARNQPHLIARKITDDSVHFFTDHVTNHADPNNLYMGEAQWVFTDENHLKSRWWSFQNSEMGEPLTFNMTRVD